MRVAELDPNGVPTPGSFLLTVDSIVEITTTPVITDGDEIKDKNGCGEVCINYKGPDSFDRLDVGITVCDHNPYVMAALGRGDILTDSGVRGYAFPALGPTNEDAVSIEFFAKRIDDGALQADYPYAWWVLPKVNNLRLGPMTFNSGSNRPSFVGRAFENENWFDGPLNDWPVSSDRVLQWFPIPELPTVSCTPAILPAS
jgi:hypothetical protein